MRTQDKIARVALSNRQTRQRISAKLLLLAISVATLSPCILGATTPSRTPLEVKSNESTEEQLNLARAQGSAVLQAWNAEVKALNGAAREVAAGEYRILVTLSAPEGWYEPGADRLVWHAVQDARAHLRVVVCDAGDGRVVPELAVSGSIRDRAGNSQNIALPFGWYPLLNGYGANLATSEPINLSLHIEAPPFRRHDPYNGDRFSRPVTAEISDVRPGTFSSAPTLSAWEEAQSDLVRAEGAALDTTVRAMWRQAISGTAKPVGDYRVACAVEYSEAYWFLTTVISCTKQKPSHRQPLILTWRSRRSIHSAAGFCRGCT